jgi:hypothetical protein
LTITLEIPIKYQAGQEAGVQLIDPNQLKIEAKYLEVVYGQNQEPRSKSRRTRSTDKNLEIMGSLSQAIKDDKKFQMTCESSTNFHCQKFKLTVENFKFGEDLIEVSMLAKIDLETLNRFRKTGQDTIFFQPNLTVQRDDSSDELRSTSSMNDLVLFLNTPFPLVIVLIALLIALVILAIIVCIMKRLGFFNRKKMELMQDYKRKVLFFCVSVEIFQNSKFL